jgi:D-methionine transport system substrate-binding protein
MKRVFGGLIILSLVAVLLVGCSRKPQGTVLKVGATPVPHAEILEIIKPILAEQGIELVIVEYDDYVQPNLHLRDREIKANFFQHTPYLERFNRDYNLSLVPVVAVHIEPMGVYSNYFTSLDQVTPGSKVLIPGDPTNGGRALNLLAKAGLLTLAPGQGIAATPGDIIDNPLQLEIVELDAAFIVNARPDAGLAVINTNFAIQAGLLPTRDALYVEDGDSPFANILVVNGSDSKVSSGFDFPGRPGLYPK